MQGIYKIETIHNGKFYIGSSLNLDKRWSRHKKDLKCGRHCNIYLQRVYKKHGIDVFRFSVVQETRCLDNKNLLVLEQKFIDITNCRNYKIGYNLAPANGGDLISNHPNKDEIVLKIKSSLLKNISKLSAEERKEKYSRAGHKNGMYGKTHTDKVKKKLSDFHKGNSYAKGRKASDKQKKSISDFAKTRIGEKNPFYGKSHSDESKNKIREANLGKLPTNTKMIEIDGIKYKSQSEASRQLGVSPATITYRLKSKNKKYSNYKNI